MGTREGKVCWGGFDMRPMCGSVEHKDQQVWELSVRSLCVGIDYEFTNQENWVQDHSPGELRARSLSMGTEYRITKCRESSRIFWIFQQKAIKICLSGLFWMFFEMYQVMWPSHTKLGHFKSICNALTQFDQYFPDWFIQNVLATSLQYAGLGKLKTHGKYIVSTWQKFSIFWKHLQFPKIP